MLTMLLFTAIIGFYPPEPKLDNEGSQEIHCQKNPHAPECKKDENE